MTPESAVETIRQALMVAFWLSAPLLIAGFVAGVIISLVQTLTSMQDSAFGAVPRLAAFLAAILVAMPWMLQRLLAYAEGILGNLGRYAR
jgi:flagellar biosynthetic protein FliQ